MKKIFKRKRALVPAPAEVDIAGLMDKIQQQLDSLEKKVDTLISQSSERPFKARSFGRPQRFDKGRRDNSFAERSFTKVICAECGKDCEVPFKPSADRPVYCRDCFAKRKEGGSFKGKRDNNFGRENREPDQRKKPFFRRRK